MGDRNIPFQNTSDAGLCPFNGHTYNLRCQECACKHQKTGKPDPMTDHSIGWLVAAVPLESGDTYWGFTSVPDDGVEWWQNLPRYFWKK